MKNDQEVKHRSRRHREDRSARHRILVAIVVAVVVLAGGFAFAVRIDDTASVGVGDSAWVRATYLRRGASAGLMPVTGSSQVDPSTQRHVGSRSSPRAWASVGRCRVRAGGPEGVVRRRPGARSTSGKSQLAGTCPRQRVRVGLPHSSWPKDAADVWAVLQLPRWRLVLVTVATGGCHLPATGIGSLHQRRRAEAGQEPLSLGIAFGDEVAATQRPYAAAAFAATPSSPPAWNTLPCWYSARDPGQGDPAGAPALHGGARRSDDRGGAVFARLVRFPAEAATQIILQAIEATGAAS